MNLIHIVHPHNSATYTQPMEMYLAQEVIKNMSPEIKHIIRKKSVYKILDNGCYELDKSISLNKLFECAEQINASEIILPDAMGNFQETLKLTTDALEYAYSQGIKKYQYMGVIQGTTWDEYMACAELFLSIREISVIGIPKKFMRNACKSDREAALARSLFAFEIAENVKKANKEVHLLGLSWSIMELTSVAHLVRSCDTNNIVENIKADKYPFSSWEESPKYSLDVPMTDEQLSQLDAADRRAQLYLKGDSFFL